MRIRSSSGCLLRLDVYGAPEPAYGYPYSPHPQLDREVTYYLLTTLDV